MIYSPTDQVSLTIFERRAQTNEQESTATRRRARNEEIYASIRAQTRPANHSTRPLPDANYPQPSWRKQVNDCSHRLDGKERVGKHVEGTGTFFADGTAERVDRRSYLDVFEAGFFQHLLPARTG